MAAMTSVVSSPANARVPVSISNSTQPNAQMSLCLAAGLPLACSGDMYPAVPSSTPTPVMSAGDVIVGDIDSAFTSTPLAWRALPASTSFARPKSSTFTGPSSRSLMFAGFRSRWTMPRS